MHKSIASLLTVVLTNSLLVLPMVAASNSQRTNTHSSQIKAKMNERKRVLQSAVNQLDSNPLVAERKLKTLTSPSSKIYLAYLYKSGKVKTANRKKTIDALMNAVMKQVKNRDAIGDIDTSIHLNNTDMYTILRTLRFISESSQGTFEDENVKVPASIFKQYPVPAFNAFDSYWGSNMDAFCSADFDDKESVENIPSVHRFMKLMAELNGEPTEGCTGSIAHARARSRSMMEEKVSIAPQVFLPGKLSKDELEQAQDAREFLSNWANEELWNKVKYDELLVDRKNAVLDLAKRYQQRPGWKSNDASLCADKAVDQLVSSCMSIVPKPTPPVVTIFSRGNVTVPQIQSALKGRKLTQDELSQALTCAILNDAAVPVINWLIDDGAPLIGKRESALFSAVRRPAVVELLLKRGAKIDAENPLGKTALIQAVQFNCLDTVKLLCKAGADVQHKMKVVPIEDLNFNCDYNYMVGGRTPLLYAASWAGYPVLSYLFEQGANRKVADSSGESASKMIMHNTMLSKTQRQSLMTLLSEAKIAK